MSKHPKVWILSPSGRHGYRLKYRDPDSGKTMRKTLKGTKYQADSGVAAKARVDAAVRKHNELTRREIALEGGAVVRSGTSLADAEQLFLNHLRAKGKKERTFETYAEGTSRFMAWAEERGLRTADEVTRGILSEFDDYLSALPGAPSTFNKRQRAVKRMIGVWIVKGKCSRLSFDDLKRLEPKEVRLKQREWLTPSQCRKMLDAALRHDRDTTGPGTPIAPFVMYSLLGGARVSEMLDLEWSHIDFNAMDVNGKVVGEIEVPVEVSKTKERRVIGLEETPSLKKLFAAMQLRSGKSSGLVWDFSRMSVKRSRNLMATEFKSPRFTYQMLRVTCDCYLNCAPGIYGSSAAFLAAQRLGHSVAVSEKYYASAIRGINRELHTLEAVLGIEKQVDQIIRSVADASHDRASVSRIAANK